MTRAEIDELDRLLAAWQRACRMRPVQPSTIGRTRKNLETALVGHADALLAAAKAQKPCGGSYLNRVPAPSMAEWPEEER